jgi:hydrogenase maturation factor HypF (carbamoyltransferase family)
MNKEIESINCYYCGNPHTVLKQRPFDPSNALASEIGYIPVCNNCKKLYNRHNRSAREYYQMFASLEEK